MASLDQIVFDATHPARLARFWAALLSGYRVRAYDAAELARLAAKGLTPDTDPVVMVDGPGPTLCFHLLTNANGARPKLHLDLTVDDRDVEVARILALGGTEFRRTDDYVVMCDPEGNRFCLVQKA